MLTPNLLARTTFKKIDSVFLSNLCQVYAAHVANFLLPLVLIPLLSRRLGAEGMGRLATFQSLAFIISTLCEYGFATYGTRETAKNRSSPRLLSELLAGITAAKLFLTAAAALLLYSAAPLAPMLKGQHLLLGACFVYSIGQATSVGWFYQGLERLRVATTCDLVGRFLGASAVVLFVHVPADAYMALLIPGLGMLVSAIASTLLAYRWMPIVWPGFKNGFQQLMLARQFFATRCVGTLVSSGNAFLLSCFVPAVQVGYFSLGERVFRASVSYMYPFTLIMFPRITAVLQKDTVRAKTLATRSLLIMIGAALCLSFLLFFLAPLVVNLVLGPRFRGAIPVLRVFALIPVFRAISDVLGYQWMIPNGLEKTYTMYVAVAAVVNLLLAAVLPRYWNEIGMTWSVLLSEVNLAGSLAIALQSRGLMLSLREIMPFRFVGPRIVSRVDASE